MKKANSAWIAGTIVLLFLILTSQTVFPDDTCVFMVTADDVPPNIVILLDNGAEMEQISWHSSYDNSINYTPKVVTSVDVVENGTAVGNGFFNANGYSIIVTGGTYYLVDVPDNLIVADHSFRHMADGDGKKPVWTINGKIAILPATPSTTIVDDVIDNATNFRYSKNYLNWIFYSGNYAGDGTDLPDKSRFYYAKKALMAVAKMAANKAQFSIYNFTSNADGASNVQPLGLVVDTPLAALPQNNNLQSNFVNNINNMGTVTYSPLAEGLASIGGYYGSPSSGVVGEYCQKNFAIVVSPGLSSEDQAPASKSSPAGFSDYDEDDAIDGMVEGEIREDNNQYAIPLNQNGTTYLDDVAYYLYSHDIVDYQPGFQNISTYTIGFMGDHLGNLFLTNTSNNGNGNVNLYDTSHEEYGKFHYEAQDPNTLASVLLAAIKDILSATSSFTAPVVPVTRTTSGNRIYMAFFKPNESNFWEGNITKFGISESNSIVDVNGDPATWPNGAMREDAEAHWQTKDWADPTKSNYIHNTSRSIYTYIGYSSDLADTSNDFAATNPNLTAAVLGNPANTTAEIINYIRGADVFDEDSDSDITDNRAVITGDVLHSEPMVVQYNYPDNTSKTMVYFGANDGMLHAILDETDPDVDALNDETNHGIEKWAFIPPDQLHRLKDLVEGSIHQHYVDSSAKAYFHDVDNDGLIDTADGDKVILIFGERKGGTSYFALDVTDPFAPTYLWRIGQSNSKNGILELTDTTIYSCNSGSFIDGDPLRIWNGDAGWGPNIAAYVDGAMSDYHIRFENGMIPFEVGQVVGNLTTAVFDDHLGGGTATPFIWGKIKSIITANPQVIIPELGESWSEPQLGRVKTSDIDVTGTAVFFIGGGYSPDNSVGKAVLAINIMDGSVVKKFTTSMAYSIASTVNALDTDGNGFVDKVYVGDLGGQIWRIGKFTDGSGTSLSFPESDENIMNWTAEILFISDPLHERKFFYPPAVTLEKGYDLVFTGTGNREDACNPTSANRIYSIKDNHSINDNLNKSALAESDLVDVTDPATNVPNLDSSSADVDLNSIVDQGWYVQLANGEKALAEGSVFYKTYYLTTFAPNNNPCLPGGVGKFYALDYKTAGAVLNFDDDSDLDRDKAVGGGIPSKVVTVITDKGGTKMLISVGSTNPDPNSEVFDAGVVTLDPLVPKINFHHVWWRELIN